MAKPPPVKLLCPVLVRYLSPILREIHSVITPSWEAWKAQALQPTYLERETSKAMENVH